MTPLCRRYRRTNRRDSSRPALLTLAADSIAAGVKLSDVLLLQGAVSSLADRLGDALMQQADAVPDGEKLRAAIEAIRVGVITDPAGNARRARTQ